MTSGNSCLFRVDYDLQPAFISNRANAISFDILEPEVRFFNQLYNFIFMNGVRLRRQQSKEIEKLLIESIRKIFHSLLNASDSQEIQDFLSELGNYTMTLLNQDLAYHFRRISYRSSRLDFFDQKMALSEKHFLTGRASDACVDAIRNLSKSTVEQFRAGVEKGHFTREDLSLGQGPVIRSIVNIINNEYRAQGVLDSISFYHGQNMMVTGCALEYSSHKTRWWTSIFGDEKTDPKTSYYHFDETFANPKSMFYLSNVSMTNGPTKCVTHRFDFSSISPLQFLIGRVINKVGTCPNSPLARLYSDQRYHISLSSKSKRAHFMVLPPQLRFNSHFGFDVIPGSQQETSLLSREFTLTGEPGTFLVFDGTRLAHRGGLVDEGERIALQLIFGSKKPLARRLLQKGRKVIRGIYSED